MATVKVYFNYELDYRHTKLFCIISALMIVVFPIILMHTYLQYYPNFPISKYIKFCCTRGLQNSTYIISSLVYTILLHNLFKRYEALNLLLKNQFSVETIVTNFRERKPNTIQLIKFIGQQRSILNDIVELNNFCYAFQVKPMSNRSIDAIIKISVLFLLQVMIMFGCAFLNTVLTFYTLYLHIIQDNRFIRTVTIMHIQWEILWAFLVLIVIHVSSQVNREVNNGIISNHKK